MLYNAKPLAAEAAAAPMIKAKNVVSPPSKNQKFN
jgi:hypothetical protein